MLKRKLFIITLILSISIISIFTGCSNTNDSENIDEEITIYTTLYELTDLSQKIGGDNVEVISLIPPGVSPHNYEPTAKDMAALFNSDIFVYNGVGLETWVEKILMNLEDTDVKLVDASKQIEPIVNEEEQEEHDEHQHSHKIDSHVWLNPLNALKQAEEIKNALIELDKDNSSEYETNFKNVEEDLVALDEKYKTELKDTTRKDFFVSHAAFGYLAEQYRLTQYSISGIMPADEPSPAELADLTKKAQELDIKYILVDSMDVSKISGVLADEIGATTLQINSIGNITKEDLDAGLDYIKIMENNLVVLKKALNE